MLETTASTSEAEHAAVMAEVEQVLVWAQAECGGRQWPVEDGIPGTTSYWRSTTRVAG
jgi:hypothetical protein